MNRTPCSSPISPLKISSTAAYWCAFTQSGSLRRSYATDGWMTATYFPSISGAFAFFSAVRARDTRSAENFASLSICQTVL